MDVENHLGLARASAQTDIFYLSIYLFNRPVQMVAHLSRKSILTFAFYMIAFFLLQVFSNQW